MSIPDYISILFFIFTVIGSVYSLIFHQITSHRETRQIFIEWLETDTILHKYRKLLRQLLHKLLTFYGPLTSLSALNKSILLAFIYPISFFVIAYVFFNGSASFASQEVFPTNYNRPLIFLLLIVYFIVLYLSLLHTEKIDSAITTLAKNISRIDAGNKNNEKTDVGNGEGLDKKEPKLKEMAKFFAALVKLTPYFTQYAVHISILFTGYVITRGVTAIPFIFFSDNYGWALIGVIFGLIYNMPTLLKAFSYRDGLIGSIFGATFGLIAGAASLKLELTGTALFSFLIVISSMVAMSLLKTTEIKPNMRFITFYLIVFTIGVLINGQVQASLLLAAFYLLLPLVNALLDWVSWMISRYFLRRASQDISLVNILADILLDFIAGVILFVLIIVLLPLGAIALESIYSIFGNYSIGWESMAYNAYKDPWGQGLMITLMAVSTIFPTLLHIQLAFFSIIIQAFGGRKLAIYLKGCLGNWRPMVAAGWIVGYMTISALLLLLVIFVIYKTSHIPISHYMYSLVKTIYL